MMIEKLKSMIGSLDGEWLSSILEKVGINDNDVEVSPAGIILRSSDNALKEKLENELKRTSPAGRSFTIEPQEDRFVLQNTFVNSTHRQYTETSEQFPKEVVSIATDPERESHVHDENQDKLSMREKYLTSKKDKTLREERELSLLKNKDTRESAARIACLELKTDRTEAENEELKNKLKSPQEKLENEILSIMRRVYYFIQKEYDASLASNKILHIALGESHADVASTLLQAIFIIVAKTRFNIYFYLSEANADYSKLEDDLCNFRYGRVPLLDESNTDLTLLGNVFLRGLCYRLSINYVPMDHPEREKQEIILTGRRDQYMLEKIKSIEQPCITITGENHFASLSFVDESIHTICISLQNIYSQVRNFETLKKLNKLNFENMTKGLSSDEKYKFTEDFTQESKISEAIVKDKKSIGTISTWILDENQSLSLKAVGIKKSLLVVEPFIQKILSILNKNSEFFPCFKTEKLSLYRLVNDLGFFQKIHDEYLIENRNNSISARHAFDTRFGLIVKR